MLTITQTERARIERVFPGLIGTDWEATSPKDTAYNCVGHALGLKNFISASGAPGTVWPDNVPRQNTLQTYAEWLARSGFRVVDDERPDGSMKVAVFGALEPGHFARQLPSGSWTSKLGRSWDITHPLRALEGDHYGRVIAILGKRKLEAPGRGTMAT